MSSLFFDFYGFSISVDLKGFQLSDFASLKEFSFFEKELTDQPNCKIRLEKKCIENKDISGIPLLKTKMGTARILSLHKKQMVYSIGSKNVALAEDIDINPTRKISVRGLDAPVLNEIIYYILMSVTGEYFDSVGIMRLHAASFSTNQYGIVVWAHSKVGKSTLTQAVSGQDNFKLFSDELTLFDLQKKQLLPFPNHISLADEKEKRNLYFFQQKNKYLIDLHKVSKPCAMKKFFWLQSNGCDQIVSPDLSQLLRLYFHVLMGTGLIQMSEYFLRPTNLRKLLIILKNRMKLILALHSADKKIISYRRQPTVNTEFLLRSLKSSVPNDRNII